MKKIVLSILTMLLAPLSFADEGGVSFWVPGQMGSFAATYSEVGWDLPFVYYHANADASRSQNFQYDTKVTAGLDSTADLLFISPTYTFKDPVWNGQFSFGLSIAVGNNNVSADADISTPGNTLTVHRSDSVTGISDLYPTASLKWNVDFHNFMAYAMAGIPIGLYDSQKLANIGLGYWAVDVGGAYTYFDTKMGTEFSATLGFTYNFENPDTNYQSGVDSHLDVGAAQMLNDRFFLGLVSYYYLQLSDDSGSGNLVGGHRSRVGALGPQVGYFIPVNGKTWYSNLKAYYEFDGDSRPTGWNLWATLSLPL